MEYLKLENNKIIFTTEDKDMLILDLTNYFANKSRIPLHSLNNSITVPNLVLELRQKYINLFIEGHTPDDIEDLLVLDFLISAQLIKTALPVKLVEFGCTNGRLSYHLASLLSAFHHDSTLCCICDTIGNESGNRWLDFISLAENTPKTSLLASEYHDTNLASEYFDLVVINGSVSYADTTSLIQETNRVLKADGVLICYAYHQPELANTVKQVFSAYDEYPLTSNSSIIVAKGADALWEKDTLIEWLEPIRIDLLLAESALLQNHIDKKELFALSLKLDKHADIANKNGIINLKLRCLELKEQLLIKYVE